MGEGEPRRYFTPIVFDRESIETIILESTQRGSLGGESSTRLRVGL